MLLPRWRGLVLPAFTCLFQQIFVLVVSTFTYPAHEHGDFFYGEHRFFALI